MCGIIDYDDDEDDNKQTNEQKKIQNRFTFGIFSIGNAAGVRYKP